MLKEPPVIDANEITEKGYINQRAVLERRASLVETLLGENPEVVLIPMTGSGVKPRPLDPFGLLALGSFGLFAAVEK